MSNLRYPNSLYKDPSNCRTKLKRSIFIECPIFESLLIKHSVNEQSPIQTIRDTLRKVAQSLAAGISKRLIKLAVKQVALKTHLVLIASLGLALLSGCSLKNFGYSGMEGSESPDSETPLVPLVINSPVCSDSTSKSSNPTQHQAAVRALVFINCGPEKRLVSVDSSGEFFIWQLSSGVARVTNTGRVPGPVKNFAFHEPSGQLAVSDGKEIFMGRLGEAFNAVSKHGIRSEVTDLAIASQPFRILMGGADGRIYQFTPDAPSPEAEIPERYVGSATIISSLAIHPAGRVFFSSDWSGRLNSWLNFEAAPYGGDISEELYSQGFKSQNAVRATVSIGPDEPIEDIKLDERGDYLVLSTQSGILQLWQIRGFKKLASIQAHTGLIYGLDIFSRQNQQPPLIATSGRDGRVVVWSTDLKEHVPGVAREGKIEILKEVELSMVSFLRFANASELYLGRDDGAVLKLDISQVETGGGPK